MPVDGQEETIEDMQAPQANDVIEDAEDVDNDWIDYDYDDDISNNQLHPNTLPKPPHHDSAGNAFITIVDMTGIHHLPVVTCLCDQDHHLEDKKYLELALFPASHKEIQTVFTFRVLNDFRLANLECKTSAYQYYSKLRRLTCPAFPKAVTNRYRELRWLSRAYRNLKLWKMHGRGHLQAAADQFDRATNEDHQEREVHRNSATPTDPPPASLALFCPACPQPGINLPVDWQIDGEYWLYIRKFCTDGNFKADHLNQRNAEDDVFLMDGDAFMTKSGPYQEHLKVAATVAKRYKEVSASTRCGPGGIGGVR